MTELSDLKLLIWNSLIKICVIETIFPLLLIPAQHCKRCWDSFTQTTRLQTPLQHLSAVLVIALLFVIFSLKEFARLGGILVIRPKGPLF